MTKQFIVDEIRRLSQDEGMTDAEIAEELGYRRESIARIRRQQDIPRYVLGNRRDKLCKCMVCDRQFYIRRCEPDRIACPECEIKLKES